jgi:predicted nucleotidyltransferase
MVSPNMRIKIPKGSKVYVFGSFLNVESPNDCDVLAVYDERICPPREAFRRHSSLVSDLQKMTELPIHLTLLTRSEERDVCFLRRTGAIPITVVFFNRKRQR